MDGLVYRKKRQATEIALDTRVTKEEE